MKHDVARGETETEANKYSAAARKVGMHLKPFHIAVVALFTGLALAGCLDVGKPSETKAAADNAASALPALPDFKLDCYKQGGHTAVLPGTAVRTNDTSLAQRTGTRALVCFTDHTHQDLGLRWTNETTSTDVLRVGSDGVATWLAEDGKFRSLEATQYVVKGAPSGGHVKVDARTAVVETGDTWSYAGNTVAKVGQRFESASVTFFVPAGYDTSP